MAVAIMLLALLLAPPEATPAPTSTATKPAATSTARTTAPQPPAPQSTAPKSSAPLDAMPAATASASPSASRLPQAPPIPTVTGAETAPLPAAAPSAAGGKAKPRGAFQIGDILVPAMWLVGVLILAAFAFSILKRLRKQEEPTIEDQAHEQLALFRKLRDEGEMSEEEYRKVLQKLQPRIKSTGEKPAGEPGHAADQQPQAKPPVKPPPG